MNKIILILNDILLNFGYKIEKTKTNKWRLPTIQEILDNIVYETKNNSYEYLENLKEEQFWTSNESNNNKDNAWAISLDKNFISGFYLLDINKNYKNSVILVKEDEIGLLEWSKIYEPMDFITIKKFLREI